jgi:hypothetical protein
MKTNCISTYGGVKAEILEMILIVCPLLAFIRKEE